MKKLLVIICACLSLVLSGNVLAADKVIKWKLAMTWSDNLSPFSDVVKNFADDVETMSNGRLVIRIDDKNKHKAALGIFDMVKAGQYQMGHTASYYYKGKDIATMPFTTMPFGMTTPEQMAWYYYGGGKDLMNKVYDKYGILSYTGGGTGNQMGGWFRKEINSAEDLKGLKMRIPGFAGEIMAKLGVAVTNIPAGELYTSLERGTIDALEWVGPGMDIRMGFHKAAPYYYTGWHEPGTDLQFMINKKAFEKLPADLQAIIETAIDRSAMKMYAQNYAMSAEAWSKMKTDFPNIKVKTFPAELIAKMKQINDELLAEKVKENPLFKEIIESQTAFMQKAREWTKMSDFLYLKDNIK